MTSSFDPKDTDSDDWFDLDKYKKAAQVAYDFSIGKMKQEGTEQRAGIEKTGEEARSTESNRAKEERSTIGKTGEENRATLGKQGTEERLSIGKSAEEQRARDRLLQQFKDREEARDRGQALKGYRF